MRVIPKFNLPSQSSLNRWIPIKNLVPGFNSRVLDLIKVNISKMDSNSREAVLIFDGMIIRKDLKFNQVEDQIEGLVDFGDHRENKYGNQVLVFMIRGLIKSWKFTLDYFVLLLKNLKISFDLGLNIRVITCDQSASNRSLFNTLNVNIDKPFFFFKKNKIFAIFDIPHLFKSQRNSLIVNNFFKTEEVNGEVQENFVASWSVIEKLYLLVEGKTYSS